MSDEPEPVEFSISDELDLHTFRPADVGELVPDYIGLCLEKKILRVRIIHGKGIGTLRETVHALLKKRSAGADLSFGRCHRGWLGGNGCLAE